ncbi:MAG: hypothetical protein HY904_01375 [Deltaproteobacteria bacterium]|nr:hypothetical protein [Deltaproteobacteria bacterium]
MELPVALKPWRGVLDLFPDEIVLGMGPLVQRVATVLGPLAETGEAWDGEPDGFDGLTRRGLAERLLVSQWLLADELPEEFLRRAAQQELHYLRLARRRPSGRRRSVALFDAGPGQMGAPRVAQLAVLVALAARARAAGIPFAFGVLQEAAEGLVHDVNESSIRALLRARGRPPATERDHEAWRAALGVPAAADDLWLVGDPLGGGVHRSASRVVVEDVLEPGSPCVDVHVWRGARVRSLRLELPAGDVTARLLRDPFLVEQAPVRTGQAALAIRSNLVFSSSGHWVLARGADRTVVAHPVPNSPRQVPARPRVLTPPPGPPVVAAGHHGRQFRTLQVSDTEVTVATYSRRGELLDVSKAPNVAQAFYVPPDELTDLEPLYATRMEGRVRWWVRDAFDGTLYELARDGTAWLRVHERQVNAWFLCRGAVVLGLALASRPTLRQLGVDGADELDTGGTGRVLAATSQRHAKPWLGAFERVGGAWRVGGVLLSPFSGAQVVGVCEVPSTGEGALVQLDPSARRVDLTGRNAHVQLPAAPGPVASVAVGPDAVAAYATERGDLLIGSLVTGQQFYRFDVGEDP